MIYPPHESPQCIENENPFVIPQFAGNISVSSYSSESNLDCSIRPQSNYPVNGISRIPTIVGLRPKKVIFDRGLPYWRRIRRDNKAVQGLSLPRISNYNMRSIFPKLDNFALDMEERESDLTFLTEVWEKLENKKHQFRLEELLELKGIQYISTPRPGAKRGGGAAIAVRKGKFSITKLNISSPGAVEIVWGLLKPTTITGKISKIIVCCFYSPPRSKKNSVLLSHLATTLQSLLTTHPNAGIVISGDRNSIDIQSLLSIDHTLRQMVKNPTRGAKTLYVILSNLHCFYDVPLIVPPIQPDCLTKGVPSDHSGVFATPLSNTNQQKGSKVTKYIRPLPESLCEVFREKMESESWDFLNLALEPTQLVDLLQSYFKAAVESTFPQKKIVISPDDKPWFTETLRQLKRQRQRIYFKQGKSPAYWQIKVKFEEIMSLEMIKYKDKVIREVLEGKRGCSYAGLKKLSMAPGDSSEIGFQLPNHVEQDLSSKESVEVIADFFAQVSQEYSPLNIQDLPINVRAHLAQDHEAGPVLSIFDVYSHIVKAKKPNSVIPGDLPPKLTKLFPEHLAHPATIIFNNITKSRTYPTQWKIENQIPIPKVHPPESEDDLRNIAKTQFLSKVYESFVAGWLLPIIQPFLDPGQCGMKGFSITHYLIKLLHFTHSILDLKQPHAVLAACVDFSKAFNRVSHNLLVQDLYDMHTPPWLLNILVSYLSNRSMVMTHNGHTSRSRALPGGGPQGALLGGIIFIVKFNGAFLRPPIPNHIKGPISRSKSEKVKFVDDGTVAVSINLKKCLIADPVQRPRPFTFHERNQLILPPENNLLQAYIEDTERFAMENKMVINNQKTKTICFNNTRKWNFPPEVKFSSNQNIENVTEVKLVGVILSSDLKWAKNTEYICKKAMKRIWTLRRMKNLGMETEHIFDTYTKEIRSVLELAVPAWHSGLTQKLSGDIERVQKIAFKIILGDSYCDYDIACTLLETEPLKNRREKLCLKFAKKDLKSDTTMFNKISNPNKTQLTRKKVVHEYKYNNNRFKNSSLPYLARLLNHNN